LLFIGLEDRKLYFCIMVGSKTGGFFSWLQQHLIPCPFKKLTGIDCPGCGFQRSLIALCKGDLAGSIHLYPATIPILFTALFVFTAMKLNWDKGHIVKKTLYMLTGGLILVTYAWKIYHRYA
jgi:hypothetical protein